MSDEDVQHIGILLFPDVEELDAIGPWEVLSYWTRTFAGDGWRVFCFSADGKSVTCAKGGLTIQPHYSMADMPALDVLLHPGGRGTRPPQLNDNQHLAWVRSQRRSVPLMTSVCTGSLVFAAAGLLAGRCHYALGFTGTTPGTRPDDRRASRRAVRRRRRHGHRRRDLGRHRHGSSPGGPAGVTGACAAGATRHSVRPAATGMT